jgi:hypothetical protein
MWGSGNIILRNFDLCHGKRLCSQGNSLRYTLNRRLSGFSVLSGRPGEARNFLTLPVIEKRFLNILTTRCLDCQNMNENPHIQTHTLQNPHIHTHPHTHTLQNNIKPPQHKLKQNDSRKSNTMGTKNSIYFLMLLIHTYKITRKQNKSQNYILVYLTLN